MFFRKKYFLFYFLVLLLNMFVSVQAQFSNTKNGRPKYYTWLERSFRPYVQHKELDRFWPKKWGLLPKKSFSYLRRCEKEKGRRV